MSAIIPIPKIPISVRPATMSDLPFIDALQKKHTKQVGWMPTKQLEGKIGAGHVLIAEEPSPLPSPCVQGEGDGRVGYCIGNDQYFKRDDVGIIYQMNVVPGKQRAFVGATLLKAQFERSAYGCKLYCCWCAQDIEANRFWESLGFVPLAFRTGSRQKSRVHIFWQKRIHAGDASTPYWFPSQTSSGSIREDRLVLPIPPGKNWWDEMPMFLPQEESAALPAPNPRQIRNRKSPLQSKPAVKSLGRLCFAESKTAAEKSNREPRHKLKNDPKLVAAARELRDRWLEQVNEDPGALLSRGKYEIARAIDDRAIGATLEVAAVPARCLPAAA